MLVAPKYAKRLNPRFVEGFSDVSVPWGPLGYVIFKRTYSRLTDAGITEEWHQTCARCVNGLIEIGAIYTHEEAEQLFWYMFSLKGTPAGRPIWQVGTTNVQRLGSDSCVNCWNVSANEPIEPFIFTFNELMLGGGVGFNITKEMVYEIPIVKHNVKVERVDDYDCDYIVPDNREGWVGLLERILKAFFYTGKDLRYDTRCIRAKGRKILGFGGVASGPEDLVKGMGQISNILRSKVGRKLTPTNCLDIFNIIGSIVVAGNCLASDTVVYTLNKGIVNISDILVGDQVLTNKGYKKVTAVFKQGIKKLVTVELTNGHQIQCTPEHRFAVVTDLYGEIDWIEAKDLVQEDTLLLNGSPCGGKYVDPIEAYFYGNFLGDGYVRLKRKKGGTKVVIGLTNDEDGGNIANKLHQYLAQECLNGKEVLDKGNGFTLEIYSIDFARKMIVYKVPKQCPIIPEWIYTADINARCAFLAGLCDADGQSSIYNMCSSKYPEFLLEVQKIASSLGIDTYISIRERKVSKQTGKIYADENMLIVNGYVSRRHVCNLINPHIIVKFKDKDKTTYDNYIPFQFAQDAVEAKHITRSEYNTLTRPSSRNNIRRNVIHKQLIEINELWRNVIPMQVREVINENEEDETYDIEVEDVHCFYANGILVHNCRRSAEIGIGSPDDLEFIGAKDWSRHPVPSYRQMANLTVSVSDTSLLPEDYWRGFEGKGEAYGLYNQDLCRNYGRLIDVEGYRTDYGITGTNPCIIGETWIQTSEGPRQVVHLLGKKFVAVNDGEHFYSTDIGFFCSDIKEVVELTTERGYSITLTWNHELESSEGIWKSVSDLKVGDNLILQKQYNIEWRGGGTYVSGYEDGMRDIQSIPRDIEICSSNYYIGFIIGLVKRYGDTVGKNIEVTCYNPEMIQRMLMRLGLLSMITGDGLYFDKSEYDTFILHRCYEEHQDKYTDKVLSINPIGRRLVYDCQIPGANRFDANGFSCANCGEIPLEPYESCNLFEMYLPNIREISEFAHVAELLFRGNKAISCLPCLSPRTQEVVSRNHRIGAGITGVLQAPHLNSAEILDAVYTHLEEVDAKISKEMRVGKSIKISTVKPSGTLSLLAGVSPGGHAEFAPYYIRRVMFANDDPIVEIARENGYNIEPKINIDGSKDYGTMVIDFPVKARPGPVASSYSAAQQLVDHEHLQTYWADNAVSKTIYMQPDEVPYVRSWLRENYHDTVKTISVSLHKEHGFKQAPYEEITEAQYYELSQHTIPIDYIVDTRVLELAETQECTTASCPVK